MRRSCASFSTVVEMSPRASDSPLTGAVVPEGTEVRTSLAELLAVWLSKVGPPAAESPRRTLMAAPAVAAAGDPLLVGQIGVVLFDQLKERLILLSHLNLLRHWAALGGTGNAAISYRNFIILSRIL